MLVALVAAGCLDVTQSDGDKDAGLAPSEAALAADTIPDGPETEPRQEVLNKTYRYPRLGMGSQSDDAFVAPKGTLHLEVRTRAVPECPYAYQSEARIVLRPPVGNETSVYLFGTGATASTMGCDKHFPRTLDLPAVAGDWRVRTGGEMMGSAQVVLVAIGDPQANASISHPQTPVVVRELHNRTYTYPRFGLGSPARDDFVVPLDVETLELRWQALPDCPYAVARDPEFVARDPSGQESVHKLYPSSQNGTISVDDCSPEPVQSAALRLLNGTWSLETRGEYQGSVRIAVAAAEADH